MASSEKSSGARPWQSGVRPTPAAEQSRPRTVQCPSCALTQRGTDCARREITFCCRCGTPLARIAGKNLDAALACALTTLLLLAPAILAPFLTTAALGATRTSILPMSGVFLWREGWPILAVVVFLFVLIFPAVRYASLTAVLLSLRAGLRPRWLGVAFRLSNALQTWAMLDVFLLGLVVAYARLRASIEVTIDTGAMCFVAAALFSLFVRATLDKAQVWRSILPDPISPPAASSLACLSCGMLVPAQEEARPCPRCAATIRTRRPESVSRAAAFLAAAMLLYLPANLYPIATIPIDLEPTAYTVLGGVVDLTQSHLIGLALLVFCASFTIPLLKIVGLSWCLLSTVRRSSKRLVAKTRVYRVIEEIGRWSMVDPLTIACFVPVLHFNALIDGRAEPAATPFAAVAILTTLAVRFFDPRLMWDRAEQAA